ncbi:MAG: alpha-amylase, partial [bacterium]
NMLKQEENAKYRTVMKNTLEFNSEILKRFVNFMNNPDEETAVAQFGKDDKYFGVCIMMVTLPGLPMFGHGQVEGFTEKYGMEFRRSYWKEQPDTQLIDRHDRELFPLLRRRYIFSEVENFLFYDFFLSEGEVDENVFAYTNRFQKERTLVVYHNKFAHTSGWIHTSVEYSVKTDQSEERRMIHKNIGEGLDLQNNKTTFTIFRDQVSGLEYIRNNQELYDKGIYIELDAFKYHVFLDFREVQDDNKGRYRQITDFLNGRGVPSIEEVSRELFLKPILNPFRELINTDTFQTLLRARTSQAEKQPDPELMDELSVKILVLLKEIKKVIGSTGDESTVEYEIRYKLLSVLQIPALKNQVKKSRSKTILKRIEKFLDDSPQYWSCIISWVFIHAIGKIAEVKSYKEQSRAWIDEWRLGKVISEAVENLETDKTNSQKLIQIIKILTTHQRWFDPHQSKSLNPYYILENLLNDNDVQQFLGINRYQGVLWFQKERYEELLDWMLIIAVIDAVSDTNRPLSKVENLIESRYAAIEVLQGAEKKSEYKVEKLLQEIKKNTHDNDRKTKNT